MSTAGLTSFTTTHGMVDRVLSHTTDVGAETFVTFLTGFTEFDVHKIQVAHLTDHGTAFHMDHADFA